MERQVFISYAANDPAWTGEKVEELASSIKHAGVSVRLDVWHQRDAGRLLSLSEWREWMAHSLKHATNILCLVSERYRALWERNDTEAGGFGVAFESIRLEHALYIQKQRNRGRVVTLRLHESGRDCIPQELELDCPPYCWLTDRDILISHLRQAGQDAFGVSSEPLLTGTAPAGTDDMMDPPSPTFDPTSLDSSGDLTDLAWRRALSACSPRTQEVACQHLAIMLGRKPLMPGGLEHALARAFEDEDRDIYDVIGNLQTVLWDHLGDSTQLDPEDHEKLLNLYLMLLVRASVLMCRIAFQNVPPDDLRVPDARNALAIAVVSHAIFGQGVWLTRGPDGVRVENMIDLAALPDEHAQHPSHKSDPLQLIKEVKELLDRADTHTEGERKMMRGRLAGKDWRPLLLDRDGKQVTEAIRRLAKKFGMGVASMAVDERPQTISSGLWQELCKALREDLQVDIGHQSAVWASRSTSDR
jgi:TIR domain